ncbi:eEF1A lysine and N-terminal methyltransferase isoform X6 [Hydra vulgaris]|uniref:EEF1A lysine and N-terminal methyltransferase isoform X6 n=1 Tax=Hydra vulgaris TaxID=6087 RepID=A0ABM4D577_HYDVU
MSIQIPKFQEEFATKTYWDSFFTKRKTAFEWYGEYADLCKFIHQYCKISSNILMVGCGNSQLSESMYDVGYERIINIDISDLLIKQMILKNGKKRHKMSYLVMDVRKITYPDLSFDIVFDKGTLDALYTDTSFETNQNIDKMFSEISRVTKIGGHYLCVTLAQPHIISKVLEVFSDFWFIRAHKLETIRDSNEKGLGAKLPVFLLVLTKAKEKLPIKILEMYVLENCERFHTTAEMLNAVKSLQDLAVTLSMLEKSTIDDSVSIDIFFDHSHIPRYSIILVDTRNSEFTSKRNGPYAVFIVPQGQEGEDTFSSKEGRMELGRIVGFDRLAIVYLQRGHIYTNIEEIKSELSQKIMELSKKGVDSKQVPFLTSGNCLGVRDIQCEVNSCCYGKIVVEDYQSSDKIFYRQLVFINQSLPISHCKTRLVTSKIKKKKTKTKKRTVDYRYLDSRVSKEVLLGILFGHELNEKSAISLLFVGIGSVCLIGFLSALFPQITTHIFEKDEQMIQVMESWFDLCPSSILKNEHLLNEKVYDVVVANSYVTNLESLLKDSGVIISVNLPIESSFGLPINPLIESSINLDIVSFDQSKCNDRSFRCFACDEVTKIRYYISRKSNASISELTGVVQRRISEFKQFINTFGKDFYNKNEWSELDILSNKFLEINSVNILTEQQ